MKHSVIVLSTVFITHVVWAGEIVLRDLDCKLMFPGESKINVVDGEKSEYTCVTLVNEATCNYKNLKSGTTQGEPTKYEVLDLNGAQIWSSESGNIKIVIDEKTRQYHYGMTFLNLERGNILNKQCTGKIVRVIK